jgi:hypothetical protein
LGARAEAEGLDCRARRSWLDRLVGQPRRRGLSNLWYGVQFPAWLVCPVSSGLAGARDVGLDPGHAESRRPAPGATLHMSQNWVWPIGMPRRASARVPHRVKQSRIRCCTTADVEFRAYRHHKDSEYPAGNDWASYPKINDALLYIRVRADTGMPLIVRNNPCPLAFDSVELCQTRLQLFIVLNRLDRSQASNIWAASETCRTAPVGGEKAVEPPTIPGYSLFGEEVDLATLRNVSMTLRQPTSRIRLG